MLNEYVIESVRRYESVGFTDRFETTPTGLRSQQTDTVFPVDDFEAEHIVPLGEPAEGTGQMLLFALRSRRHGVRGIWVVPRDASLPRDARRLVQRLMGPEPHRAWARRLPLGPPRAGDHLIDGAMVGVIGASAVALWFLAIDMLLREPLYTPSLVATRLFQRGVEVRELPIDLGSVSLFVVLHGLLFITFGIGVAWLVARHVRRPRFPLLFLGLFAALELGFVAGSQLLMPEVTRAIGHWAILGGNALAAAGMAVYLRWFQPHPADAREAFAPRQRVTRLTRRQADGATR